METLAPVNNSIEPVIIVMMSCSLFFSSSSRIRVFLGPHYWYPLSTSVWRIPLLSNDEASSLANCIPSFSPKLPAPASWDGIGRPDAWVEDRRSSRVLVAWDSSSRCLLYKRQFSSRSFISYK